MYIVKAEAEQIEKIVNMSIRAFETDVNVGGAKGDCPPGFDSAEWHQQMAREGHLYQAMIGKELVGAAIVFPDETKNSVYIGRIFIDSIYHRKGYGIRLMDCIGEFSRLSHLTVKALRFYEKEGILLPASTDKWTGYRLYETAQLEAAASVKAYRQLGLSIEEIRAIQAGADVRQLLIEKAKVLTEEKRVIDSRLSIIHHILEDREMRYQVTEKTIPEMIVYSSETVLAQHMDIMRWIPSVGGECLRLNPGMKCADPPYEFCEFLDGEYRETDVKIRHSEAVTAAGKGNDQIRFRRLPAAKVLSVFHKGSYDSIVEAYAFLMRYAEQNGFHAAGPARECYIDGIWNKESEEDWLTEIQLPIE